MNTPSLPVTASAAAAMWRGGSPTARLLGCFAVAVGLRLAVGGVEVETSAAAGLVFAACLLAVAAACRVRPRPTLRAVAAGFVGGAVLCIPAMLARLAGVTSHRPQGDYVRWAVIVAIVAVAEEMFLRGALYDAVNRWRGPGAAAVIGAVCFAMLHVPLYGWGIVPLDLAVGVWLAVLRVYSGSPTAPAVAHVTADLAAWWLR